MSLARKAFAALVLTLALASPALAGDTAVAGVEVHANVRRDGRDLEAELRSAVVDALAKQSLPRVPKHRRVVLDTSLTKLDTAVDRQAATASAEISMVLRDEARGGIVAILKGRAKAETVPNAARIAEGDAIEAAVKGAVSALPKALAK